MTVAELIKAVRVWFAPKVMVDLDRAMPHRLIVSFFWAAMFFSPLLVVAAISEAIHGKAC